MRLARSDTSGGDQATVLSNTGLIITWPRFILFRPLPEQTPKMPTPLVKVDDDPTRPGQAIAELLERQAGCPK